MIISQLTGAPLLLMSKANDEILHLGMGFVVKSMNDRKECKMLDLEGLTFGQWVDLDVYLTGGLDTNIEKIIAILTPDAKWADEAMWAIDQYAAFRTYIYRQYSVLFGINQKQTFDELEPETKDKQANARAWYKIIVGLANGDILKLDEVTEQSLKKTLNFMSLQKEQQLEENQRKLKERRQYDLQRNRR